jgi:hypothetical protein
MFPQARDQSRKPTTWRSKLYRAADAVVAFATLDSYTLSGAPREAPAATQHPHDRRREPLRRTPRTRGHGVPPVAPAVCVSTVASRRPLTRAAERSIHSA